MHGKYIRTYDVLKMQMYGKYVWSAYKLSTIHGKYMAGESLANHAGESYRRGKIWRISNSQRICYIHFPCICGYW